MATADTIKSNLQLLGFDNTSQTAIYNKIAQSLGLIVDSTLTEIQNSENFILGIINSQRYGKGGYYTKKALAFQYGDNLVADPVTLDYVYAAIDATKQIVNQAAFEEIVSGNSSQLFLKIATLNATSGLLEPLSADQLSAFKNYFVNFEVPGLPVSIISSPANILSFTAKATYYATYDFATLKQNLLNALVAFRDSFTFNGEFFAGDLQTYIKANVPGVRDFFIYNTTIDGVPFIGSQSLYSGYFNYVTNFADNINYLAV